MTQIVNSYRDQAARKVKSSGRNAAYRCGAVTVTKFADGKPVKTKTIRRFDREGKPIADK